MGRYAFAVTATSGYEEPVTALINSINRYHEGIDIVLFSRRSLVGSLPDRNVCFVELPDDLDDMTAAINYRWEAVAALEYDVVCMLDADMFLLRNLEKYFSAVDGSGSIIATSDCTNILYHQPYRDRLPGLLGEDFYNSKTICAVPIFVVPSLHGDILRQVYQLTRSGGNADDLLCLNMLLSSLPEVWNRMIVLPAYAWTGIHHAQLKPETRIRKIMGQYMSEAGDEVYMVHGRWFDEQWVAGLRLTMLSYFKNHFNMRDGQADKFIQWVDDSVKTCVQAYGELL